MRYQVSESMLRDLYRSEYFSTATKSLCSQSISSRAGRYSL